MGRRGKLASGSGASTSQRIKTTGLVPSADKAPCHRRRNETDNGLVILLISKDDKGPVDCVSIGALGSAVFVFVLDRE